MPLPIISFFKSSSQHKYSAGADELTLAPAQAVVANNIATETLKKHLA
jgi:hypothetical protein